MTIPCVIFVVLKEASCTLLANRWQRPKNASLQKTGRMGFGGPCAAAIGVVKHRSPYRLSVLWFV
jgi:hypothetical protein